MTPGINTHSKAAMSENHFVDLNSRRLAYRQIGSGTPIILCNRFRGNMDSRDPAFLDALARNGFQVTWFDYSGLGLSTGERTYAPTSLAGDALELSEALEIDDFVLGGWSVGGIAAQVALALHGDRISHLVLLATTPPGRLAKQAEPLFFELAARHNDEEDEVALFFEPTSSTSRERARLSHARTGRRTESRSAEIPIEWAASTLRPGPQEVMFPSEEVLAIERVTTVPLLHIGGDHDIVFPVENWYALNGQLPTLQVLTFPSAGHGPHQQHPDAAADHIGAFVNNTTRP